MSFTSIALDEDAMSFLRELKEKLEKERGGKWTYSALIRFLREVYKDAEEREK